MSMESELGPYVDALRERKAPVPPMELIGYINAVVEIVKRHNPSGSGGGGGIGKESIEECVAQVDDCLKQMAQSAVDIMDHIDTVMDAPNIKPDQRAALLAALEACSFQDIVSQRLLIVRQHLSGGHDSKRGISTGINKSRREEVHKDDHLLNGPASGNKAMDQAAIDALLNG
ncbi:MAG: hypothetical protein ACMVY4_00895 [Minwuia sp.]|uniref:hypothetical protein n=1 Tax=Minwuia sp. TaxID=2493630 RepID=UPI003A86C599